MKLSSRHCVVLWLALSCALAGCSKPQPPADTGSTAPGASGASGQTNAQTGTSDAGGTDAAARIFAEAIKQRAASSAAQRSPAEILSATPTPSLDDPFGAKGQPFTSFEGKFIVTPPRGFPPLEHSSELSQETNREVHKFLSELPGTESVLFVGYEEFKEGTNASPRQRLEAARDSALKAVNSTLEKQESLTIQDSPALSLYLSTPMGDGGKQLYTRLYFVINAGRIYGVSYSSYDRAELDSPQAEAFFKSFTLL
ncbi:MAG: hypothetical protein ABR563_03440 [Pyrinomonadaceae bacterium]